MMTKVFGDECRAQDDGGAEAADAVLIWHTSGQQGLILATSGDRHHVLGSSGEAGLMAVAMQGAALAPGDVLANGGRESGILVARGSGSEGLQLMRFAWAGGRKAVDVAVCGLWQPIELNSSSAVCTVVLAFANGRAANSASPTSSSILGVLFACGYDDGTCFVHVTRQTFTSLAAR
jgi:hypothetical protein